MKLQFKIYNNNEEKYFELILVYKSKNKDIIINKLNSEYNELKKHIYNLENEINLMKEEKKKSKIFNNINIYNNINFNIISDIQKNDNDSPIYIQFLENIITDSYSHYALDNTFIVFKSINNILNLIYANRKNSILNYNLTNDKKIIEIKNAHNSYITNFRHYLDKIKNIDLIISVCSDENNIKLWNLNNWDCLCNIKNINKNGCLHSAALLNDNNNFYIITCNDNYNNSESIKIFDFNGNKIKEIKESNERTFFIEIYYDKKLFKNYIITGNNDYVKSYDYINNNLYHEYFDNSTIEIEDHDSVIINDNDEIIKMIESSEDGNIRIWDFHSGILLNKIKTGDHKLYGICLWNNNFLFVGCDDKCIKLINLQKKIVINNLVEENAIITIKKIFHPKYGECLISNDWRGNIKIWTIC